MSEPTLPKPTLPEPTLPEPTALLLAAGKGTRMRSPLPKPLVPVAGRALVLRAMDAFAETGVTRQVLVVGHGADAVMAAVGDRATYALQADQRGMAHAVECAREAVGDAPEIYVFVGDTALMRPESIRALRDRHRATGALCSFLTADFPRRLPYARVLRDLDGRLLGCVEERDASPAQAAVRELLGSHYLFRAEGLWPHLAAIGPHPRTGERYLTDIIGILLARGERVEAVRIPDWRELVGPNTPEELAWAEAVLAGEDPPLPEGS